jgi:TRAP-type C4-dicarboxylate transport system permease small subunit
MKLIEAVLRRGAFAAAVVAGLLLATMTLLITWQTVQRNVLGDPFLFIDEFSGYLVLAVLALGLPLTLMDDALLRVDAVISQIRGRSRLLMHLLFDALGACFCVIVSYELIQFTYRNYVLGIIASTPMMTPLAIPLAVAAIGFGLFSLCQVWKLAEGLHALLRTPLSEQEATLDD